MFLAEKRNPPSQDQLRLVLVDKRSECLKQGFRKVPV